MDDLIRILMHVFNHMSWLIGGPTGKCPNHFSLKLKVVVKCGHLKVLADAMKAFFGPTNLNT